jgi:hypothetical protein
MGITSLRFLPHTAFYLVLPFLFLPFLPAFFPHHISNRCIRRWVTMGTSDWMHLSAFR